MNPIAHHDPAGAWPERARRKLNLAETVLWLCRID
jgi:hypothetical protein